ncbi:hypothetical protein ACHAWF_010939 [Thalassiosira exigua]
MTTKLCDACHQELSKDSFSLNQWKGSRSQRRCKGCIASASGRKIDDGSSAVNSTNSAEQPLYVPEDALSAAMRFGERTESIEDGAATYLHNGTAYVVALDGKVSARRVEPLQCTCRVGEHIAGIENGFVDFHPVEDDNHSRVRDAMQQFMVELRKTQEGGDGVCANFKTSDKTRYPPFCLGGKHCKQGVHRTPTDHVAILLEKKDWASPEMCGVLAYPGLTAFLIMAAAGSLLRPVRCRHCYGVAKLVRSQNIYDESDAHAWMRQLLGLHQKHLEKRHKKFLDDLKAEGGSVLDRFTHPDVAAGLTPLAVAAIGGHYRCTLELLKQGATVDTAMRRINGLGQLAVGHIFCYLMAQSYYPPNKRLWEDKVFCRYQDILGLFCYGLAYEENYIHNIPINQHEKLVQTYKDAGVWKRLEDSFVNMGYMPIGYISDGTHLRLVIKGKKGCLKGVVVISSIGLKIPTSETTVGDFVYSDPLIDPVVMEMVKRVQKATKKIKPKGYGCCEFSHEVNKIMEKEHMQKIKTISDLMKNANCRR